MSKKKCLVCMVGLPRTYQKTFAYFYNNIIKNNNHEYDFDIITHTNTVDPGIDDLYSKMCSNYFSIGRDVSVNDTGSSNIMMIRIMECYKHVHDKLNKPYYDLYMTVRFDLLIHFPVFLRNVESNIVCLLDHRCDGPNRRFHDVNDRDWDFSFIGKHDVFRCAINAIDEYFEKDSTTKYKMCESVKNVFVNPKWTSDTCPAFIHPFYEGQMGSRMVNMFAYTKDNRGCYEHIFTKLNEINRYIDFKWGVHNCFVGHLVR